MSLLLLLFNIIFVFQYSFFNQSLLLLLLLLLFNIILVFQYSFLNQSLLLLLFNIIIMKKFFLLLLFFRNIGFHNVFDFCLSGFYEYFTEKPICGFFKSVSVIFEDGIEMGEYFTVFYSYCYPNCL